jgi:hypothetical protein
MPALRLSTICLVAVLPLASIGQTPEAVLGHTLGGQTAPIAPKADRHDVLMDFEHRVLAIAWRDRFLQLWDHFEAEGRAYLLHLFWMHCDGHGIALAEDDATIDVERTQLEDGTAAWLVSFPSPTMNGEALQALLLFDGHSPRYFLLERATIGGDAQGWIVAEWLGKLDDGELSMHVKYGPCDSPDMFAPLVCERLSARADAQP